ACPTDSGFIADQDRATIAKSSTLPYDLALRVTSPAADEGRGGNQQIERKSQNFGGKKGVIGDKSRDDAPIKGRSNNEGEAAAERISNDSEEIARVLTSMDAATVLAGETNVPTASLIVRRRKGKEVMVESDTPKKKKLQEQFDAQVARELEEQQEREDMRMNEQIARDAEVARIHAEEEIQGMIDSLDKSNETVDKYLQEYQQFAPELPLETKIELISDLKQVEDFIPIGSKEEAERLKKKGIKLEKEQVKKQKSSEEAPETETSTKEFTEDKIKEIMQLVQVEDVYVQALQGEGSGTPTEPHHTPFPEADTSSHPTTSSIPLPSIPTASIPPVTQPITTPIRQYLRKARIAQSFALLTLADEPASPVRDVSEGEACLTESGFITDQDRATIAKSSTLPHDLAPRAQEEEIVRLKEKVKVLEDKKDVIAKQSGDDAPIKGRSINEGEAAAERISNDLEEVAKVLTSIDAATVLAGGIDVPTGSDFIPKAGPPATVISTGSEVSPTASLIVTRRKGKEVMVESDTPKKKKLQEQIDAQVARELEEQQEKENMRMNEQIARDTEVARIHEEEELQGMIASLDKSNETIAKYLQEYQDFALELPLEKRIELISDLVKYQDNNSKVLEAG
nr:hypothetical protein [Tanacetum cinerariifolium]